MSGFFEKLKRANELLAKKGLSGLIDKLFCYIRYNLKDKWRFIYFELDLTADPYSLPDMGESMVVRRAQSIDISKIKNELYLLYTIFIIIIISISSSHFFPFVDSNAIIYLKNCELDEFFFTNVISS